MSFDLNLRTQFEPTTDQPLMHVESHFPAPFTRQPLTQFGSQPAIHLFAILMKKETRSKETTQALKHQANRNETRSGKSSNNAAITAVQHRK